MARFNRNGLARLGGALCVVLVAGAVVGPVAVSSGKSPAPTQAQIASRLAQQLTTARTPAARYQALVAIMRASHIGVYRGNGRPIVRGAERTAKDLYVYDFTLKALAGNMAAGRTTTVSRLAALLEASLSPLKRERPITGAMLRSALASGAQWAIHHPRAEAAAGDLLIREIGLRRVHQDIAKPPALTRMKLDDAQAFLITANLTAALVERARGAHVGAAFLPQAGHSASFVGDLCGEWLKPAYKAYKWAEFAKKLMTTTSLVGGIQVWVMKTVVSNLTIGAINAYIIDKFVEFKASGPTHDGTHYGAPGHAPEAGKRLSFQARLAMSLNVPDFVSKCGYLTGLFSSITGGSLKIPKGGAMPNVPVTWEYMSNVPGESQLESHGTVLRIGRTDADGKTWLYFAPDEEPIRGVGAEKSWAGAIVASVNPQNDLLGQWDITPNLWALLPPKRVPFSYAISGHVARGYKIYIAPPAGQLRDDFGYGYDDLISISAKVCGKDPYAKPWSASAVAKNHLGQTELLTGTVSFSGAGVWSPVETTYQDGITWELQMALPSPQQPPRMALQGWKHRSGSATTLITENTDCPAV